MSERISHGLKYFNACELFGIVFLGECLFTHTTATTQCVAKHFTWLLLGYSSQVFKQPITLWFGVNYHTLLSAVSLLTWLEYVRFLFQLPFLVIITNGST